MKLTAAVALLLVLAAALVAGCGGGGSTTVIEKTVTVTISTHSEGGLTEADFELATSIEALA